MIDVTEHALLKIDVPAGFLDMEVPPGYTMKQWLAEETARIAALYPERTAQTADVSPELGEMLRTADYLTKWGLVRAKLTRLRIREEMRDARKAVADGRVIAERRMYGVRGYSVEPYSVDAIFAVRN